MFSTIGSRTLFQVARQFLQQRLHLRFELGHLFFRGFAWLVGDPVPNCPEVTDVTFLFRPDGMVDPQGGEKLRGLGRRCHGTDGKGFPESRFEPHPG